MELRDLFSEDDVDERLDAEKALADMPVRDAAIVLMCARGYTQVEIGERVGCSQAMVSRILRYICKQ